MYTIETSQSLAHGKIPLDVLAFLGQILSNKQMPSPEHSVLHNAFLTASAVLFQVKWKETRGGEDLFAKSRLPLIMAPWRKEGLGDDFIYMVKPPVTAAALVFCCVVLWGFLWFHSRWCQRRNLERIHRSFLTIYKKLKSSIFILTPDELLSLCPSACGHSISMIF